MTTDTDLTNQTLKYEVFKAVPFKTNLVSYDLVKFDRNVPAFQRIPLPPKMEIMGSSESHNPDDSTLNPSALGHLNPSSYCDVGRLFYGVFKLWSKLQRKK